MIENHPKSWKKKKKTGIIKVKICLDWWEIWEVKEKKVKDRQKKFEEGRAFVYAKKATHKKKLEQNNELL